MERRVLLPGTKRLPAALSPDLRSRSYRIDVELRDPVASAGGVLLACGDRQAGYALHVDRGRAVHTYRHAGLTAVAMGEVDPMTMVLGVMVNSDAADGADVAVLADDTIVGCGRIERLARARHSYGGLDIGLDRGVGVGEYEVPFAFTGSIRRVVVTAHQTSEIDHAGALEVELATG